MEIFKPKDGKVSFPSLLDREIDSKENDLFGHIHYAEILYSLIKNNEPPFSIGLLGKWGVGKSSIKKLCLKEFLSKEKSKYKIIDFNAWRYESKDIRTSLLKEIYTSIGGKEENLLIKTFKEVSQTVDKSLSFGTKLKNFVIAYFFNILIIILQFFITIGLFKFFIRICGFSLSPKLDIILFGLIYLITYYFMKKPYEYTSSYFPRYFKKTIKDLLNILSSMKNL